MNHSNMYAVGLALCTFANIAGEEMSRDLCNEIEKLLGSSNTYIRKKVGSSFFFWVPRADLHAIGRVVRTPNSPTRPGTIGPLYRGVERSVNRPEPWCTSVWCNSYIGDVSS